MHSSFLTWVNAGLALYSTILLFKLIIQFGLPNHPSRFTSYVISLCVSAFFLLESATSLGFFSPIDWLKWRALPLVCGSLGLLFQAMMTSGQFNLLQQKIISRLPLIAGLICFAFFPSKADLFMAIAVISGSLFLSISVGKARYQKRSFLKLTFFLLLTGLCRSVDEYWVYNLGQIFLFLSLFYFYIFQHTFGISALIDDYEFNRKGMAK
jgi:hypothetical protein